MTHEQALTSIKELLDFTKGEPLFSVEFNQDTNKVEKHEFQVKEFVYQVESEKIDEQIASLESTKATLEALKSSVVDQEKNIIAEPVVEDIIEG